MVIMVPAIVLGVTNSYVSSPPLSLTSLIYSTVFSVIIALAEIFMYYVLFHKIIDILEYRNAVKKVLMIELTLSLVFLVILDIILIYCKLDQNRFDKYLRSFSYLVRMVLLIQFFSDLLNDLERHPRSGISNSTMDLMQDKLEL